MDETTSNSRAIRNRFTNVYAPISVQPIFNGPAYILRNIEYNTVNEQIKFHAEGTISPNGVFAYHNNFVSPFAALQVGTPNPSHHFTLMNNLFIGPTVLPFFYTVDWEAPIDDGLFDYNGYYPDGRFIYIFG
jgi:hypothetical protein